MIAFMPRLLVYHCDAEDGSKQSKTFKVMEWRLLKAINPEKSKQRSILIAVWVFHLPTPMVGTHLRQ